jgi:hypothetical protein
MTSPLQDIIAYTVQEADIIIALRLIAEELQAWRTAHNTQGDLQNVRAAPTRNTAPRAANGV